MLRSLEQTYGYTLPVCLVLFGLVAEWGLIGLVN